MTDQEILTKAVQKAAANGWKHNDYYDDGYPYYMIWQHSFAKALWGEENATYSFGYSDGTHSPEFQSNKNWQYHLQQMVIADDPIKYLGEHI